jgi:Protein of unknown function (DUF1761)
MLPFIVPVLAAGVASFAIGGLWYSLLFAKPYIAARGLKPEDLSKGGHPLLYLSAFVIDLVAASAMRYLLPNLAFTGLVHGVIVGAAIFGFIAVYALKNQVFSGKPFTLYAIDSGYHLVSLVVMGAIIGVWIS